MSLNKIVLGVFGTAAAAAIIAEGAAASATVPHHATVRPAIVRPVANQPTHASGAPNSDPVTGPAPTGGAQPCTYPPAPGTAAVCGKHARPVSGR